MEVHHVGIATEDADAMADLAAAVLGAPVAHEEVFDDISVTFLSCGATYLELLEPLADAEGTIPEFLDRRGPGLHHVAFATEDLEAALQHARAAGVEPIDESPRPGAWGHEVAFLHPEDTGGVLFELLETGD